MYLVTTSVNTQQTNTK